MNRIGVGRMVATTFAVAMVAGGSALLAADAAGAAEPNPVVQDCDNVGQVKPAMLILACADRGLVLQNVVWKNWGDGHATGSGTLIANTCVPNCAAGNYTRSTVTVELGAVTGSDHHFSEVTITYPDGTSDTRILPARQN
ncbi:hypothetical protein [Antrihabitans stalactiti]|uniref:Secreted protein n=1 Tax=Antrihabitans stalactiti TaxID=2584121 RepID=A0A848K571_9NOCA|nr:hypothetical protein [Antrihabitans stalactiti]NMN94245.1 hypothetical protein [Antrihabitans stalactiti]